MEIEVEILNQSQKTQKIILDHEISLLRSNGSHTVKCFKGKALELKSRERNKVTLKVPLKPVTTRAYYSGKQYWNSKVNGISQEKLSFTLSV